MPGFHLNHDPKMPSIRDDQPMQYRQPRKATALRRA